jgi:hypothetical protein
MSDPPLLNGGNQVTVTWDSSPVATTDVGGSGWCAGIDGLEKAGVDVPIAFVAVTVN